MFYVTEQMKVAEHSFELTKSVIVSIYLCQNAVLISIKQLSYAQKISFFYQNNTTFPAPQECQYVFFRRKIKNGGRVEDREKHVLSERG